MLNERETISIIGSSFHHYRDGRVKERVSDFNQLVDKNDLFDWQPMQEKE